MSRFFEEKLALLRLGSRQLLEKGRGSNQGVRSPDEAYCDEALKRTSRSFAAVIMSLGPELQQVVQIFYLVLRGLDAVEDDMKVPLEVRGPLLIGFKDRLLRQDDVDLAGVGPSAAERDLLEHFSCVARVFQTRIQPRYQAIILNTTQLMAEGMYKMAAIVSSGALQTVEELQEYCHYVAGLVGIGLSDLFAASGTESPQFSSLHHYANSMGLFLQKTNIIRDFGEDWLDSKVWWPRQITSQYVADPSHLLEPHFRPAALSCLNHMVADALPHAIDSLYYLSQLSDLHNLRFCAIPQIMAVATLAACYDEPRIFQPHRGPVKIPRSTAAHIFLATTDFAAVLFFYRQFARDLAAKVRSVDPNAARLNHTLSDFLQRIDDLAASRGIQALALPSTSTRSLLLVGCSSVAFISFLVYWFRSSSPSSSLIFSSPSSSSSSSSRLLTTSSSSSSSDGAISPAARLLLSRPQITALPLVNPASKKRFFFATFTSIAILILVLRYKRNQKKQ